MEKLLKFGGTSVGTPQNILKICEILKTYPARRFSIVVSAFGGVTDTLIVLGKQAEQGDTAYQRGFELIGKRHREAIDVLLATNQSIQQELFNYLESILNELHDLLHGVFLLKELSLRSLDLLMSFGERLSSRIIAAALTVQGIPAQFLDTRDLVITDEHFGNARVDWKTTRHRIVNYFKDVNSCQVITGFIGATKQNETTTLGRGGSDYTASLFGAALEVSEIEIWTDVDGIMTADPRKVAKAFPMSQITYEEAMEMSHFGAKVIHPPTIQPARELGISLRIKNTFNPLFPGTLITTQNITKEYSVKGISSITNIALLRVQGSGMIGVAGIAMRLFSALAQKKINIILITQASSEHSICIAVAPHHADLACDTISEEFKLELNAHQIDPVKVEDQLSIIAIVGENMKRTPGISGRLFQALGKNGINVVAIAQGSTELNISVVVTVADENKALNAIHDAFFLSDTKTINLFMVGCGLIGKTLLSQIQAQTPILRTNHKMEIRLIGLANTKKMIFNEKGIPLDHCCQQLSSGEEPSLLREFIDNMIFLNMPNSIFIDCTAGEDVIPYYNSILSASISLVTPNKIANSSSMDIYRQLKTSAQKHNVKFYYETNVGAGLPIISTLNDLLASGDNIERIEAILSGTISYIFNNYTGTTSFAGLVRQAQELGLTEPDPRDDLSALDAARKSLILAREMGWQLELKDIVIESIAPREIMQSESLDVFYDALEKNDAHFKNQLTAAQKENKVLRYISVLADGEARLQLTAVEPGHPFYHLDGSDNMIVFFTSRYKERPLVVRGPGAGAEVTAAGVFADILKIARYISK